MQSSPGHRSETGSASEQSAHGARHQAPESSSRKRPHTDAASAGPETTRQRLRASVACTVCRGRKTKCDAQRPVCGYCQRTGSVCQYDTADGGTIISSHGVYNAQFSGLPASHHQSTHSEGLDTILGWTVFPPGSGPLRHDSVTPVPMPDELPPMSPSELRRFQAKYLRIVHVVNPLLDLSLLEQYVTQVLENGLDWSNRTCIVALVCAIGAVCEEPPRSASAPDHRLDPDRQRQQRHDSDIAYRWWSVACKRLGRAMSLSTLESAQCLCLAGIWYMCILRPVEAWKHFTMAGNCWYSAVSARNVMPSQTQSQESRVVIPQPVEQSIFYTAYKSEMYVSEIRCELGFHGSALEHIQDQLMFPSPPTLGQSRLAESESGAGTDEDGRQDGEEASTWYFYLSDIAARHLISRIINVSVRFGRHGIAPDSRQVQALLRDYRIFSSHLEDWYRSLPPEMSFEKPNSTDQIDVCPTWHSAILRARYLFIHELICRPFIRICLNYHMDLPETQLDEIAAIASLGLQHCMWKLYPNVYVSWRHQGAWTGIRNSVLCSMLLIGAARSSRYPTLNVASRMWLPDGWHDAVTNFVQQTAADHDEIQGGVKDCFDLLRNALNDFPDG
ncbi:hypothetical protein F5X68DRAFT_172161 [Plectosphaerella plurivora]|uniref:Zn(2)-C6 fungal-type domain-containing protein n=1 Tax=Plectosphaerella plurivora TaxID=936078 RepID=A0A9P8V5P4_9PEZI|nr:hypothetical protein F5X68DRAFT_172161 [Plectosphaerella plurivora]